MRLILSSLTTLAVLSTAPFAAGAAEPADNRAALAPAASTATTCNRVLQMGGLQRRLVAKASDGPDALRNFIWRTRGIYQLDMESVVAWLESERDAEVACIAAAAGSTLAKR